MKALAIGRITMDHYWKDGETIMCVPGGSAFNIASWFEMSGFESALSTTVSSDFPENGLVGADLCAECSATTPVVDIYLTTDRQNEETVVGEGEYELHSLPEPSESFDVVMLTSVEEPFVRQFERTSASVKAYDPGQMTSAYRPALLRRGFEQAEHVLLSDSEQAMVEETLCEDSKALRSRYELDSIVVTADTSVVVYLPDSTKQIQVDRIDNPVDTIGAGDALAARYLEGVIRGEGVFERTRRAIEKARRTVQRVGSLPEYDFYGT